MNLLNISLDTLRPDRFEQMTRRRGHDRVLRSIQTAIDLGYDPVKVRPVCLPEQCMLETLSLTVKVSLPLEDEFSRSGEVPWYGVQLACNIVHLCDCHLKKAQFSSVSHILSGMPLLHIHERLSSFCGELVPTSGILPDGQGAHEYTS